MNSTHVTADIVYKPSKGLKWKEKKVVTQRQLQVHFSIAKIKTRSQSVGVQTRVKAMGKSSSKNSNF